MVNLKGQKIGQCLNWSLFGPSQVEVPAHFQIHSRPILFTGLCHGIGGRHKQCRTPLRLMSLEFTLALYRCQSLKILSPNHPVAAQNFEFRALGYFEHRFHHLKSFLSNNHPTQGHRFQVAWFERRFSKTLIVILTPRSPKYLYLSKGPPLSACTAFSNNLNLKFN